MHILIGVVLIAVTAFLIYRAFGSGPASLPRQVAVSGAASPHPFAYLANGVLFLRRTGAQAQELDSPYIHESIARRDRARQRHSWKEGTSFNIQAGGGRRSFESIDRPLVATTAAYAPNGDLYYCLRDETIGGLFRREAASDKELRIMLRQGLHLTHLAISPDGRRLAASVQEDGGVSSIALFDNEGNDFRIVTGGDTVDVAPAWIPDAPARLLFQSAGLARDENGYLLAQSHNSIQILDMDTGTVEPILDNEAFDYLKPRVDADGNLLFIRRPFELPRYKAENAITDVLFFPFRLLRALFHYLNFFSLMYSRKPLTSADNPSVKADIKDILLQGKRIDAEKALRNERPVQGIPSLVPASWTLVRRSPSGDETVLATNVASYDLSTDGVIVYSNGRGVFVIEPDGQAALAMKGDLVAEVAAG